MPAFPLLRPESAPDRLRERGTSWFVNDPMPPPDEEEEEEDGSEKKEPSLGGFFRITLFTTRSVGP